MGQMDADVSALNKPPDVRSTRFTLFLEELDNEKVDRHRNTCRPRHLRTQRPGPLFRASPGMPDGPAGSGPANGQPAQDVSWRMVRPPRSSQGDKTGPRLPPLVRMAHAVARFPLQLPESARAPASLPSRPTPRPSRLLKTRIQRQTGRPGTSNAASLAFPFVHSGLIKKAHWLHSDTTHTSFPVRRTPKDDP